MLGDAKDQHSWILWSTLWLSQCLRVARDGAICLIFTDWRQLPSLTDAVQAAGWKWLGVIPWDKRSARPQIGKFRQQCEYVVFGVKGSFSPNTRQCLPGLYSYPVIPARKNHLTAKPVQLIRDLLAIAPEGGSVLDPFMAAGRAHLFHNSGGKREAIQTGSILPGGLCGRKVFGIGGQNFGLPLLQQVGKPQKRPRFGIGVRLGHAGWLRAERQHCSAERGVRLRRFALWRGRS